MSERLTMFTLVANVATVVLSLANMVSCIGASNASGAAGWFVAGLASAHVAGLICCYQAEGLR